jgi:hypothetical protein
VGREWEGEFKSSTSGLPDGAGGRGQSAAPRWHRCGRRPATWRWSGRVTRPARHWSGRPSPQICAGRPAVRPGGFGASERYPVLSGAVSRRLPEQVSTCERPATSWVGCSSARSAGTGQGQSLRPAAPVLCDLESDVTLRGRRMCRERALIRPDLLDMRVIPGVVSGRGGRPPVEWDGLHDESCGPPYRCL